MKSLGEYNCAHNNHAAGCSCPDAPRPAAPCGTCGGDARGCNCEEVGDAYGRLRTAIDNFAEVTGHGLKLVIKPPSKSNWPRIEMNVPVRK